MTRYEGLLVFLFAGIILLVDFFLIGLMAFRALSEFGTLLAVVIDAADVYIRGEFVANGILLCGLDAIRWKMNVLVIDELRRDLQRVQEARSLLLVEAIVN